MNRLNRKHTSNKRKKDIPSVLNKVKYDGDNPLGLVEDQTSTLSSNFGKDREPQKGKCIVGDGNVHISIPGILATDTVEYLHGGDTVLISNDRIDIPLDNKVFGIKIFRSGTEWAFYKCDSGSTTTLYDSSGNGNHGTIINYYSGFWGIQNVYSWQNEVGYSEGVDELIPRDELIKLPPFKDVLGNDLQYVGKVPSRAKFVESGCFQGDGVGYLTGDVLTTDVITAGSGLASLICNVDGRLDFVNGEKYWDINIERGGVLHARLPLCEPIIDAANHIYHDVSGNGNHATLVNGSLDNNGKQDEFHWLQRGFSSNFDTTSEVGASIYTDYYNQPLGRKFFIEFYLDISKVNPGYGYDIFAFRDTEFGEFTLLSWGTNGARLVIPDIGILAKGLTLTPGFYKFDFDFDAPNNLVIYRDGVAVRVFNLSNTLPINKGFDVAYASIFSRSRDQFTSVSSRYVPGIIGGIVNVNDVIKINTYKVLDELNPHIRMGITTPDKVVRNIFPTSSEGKLQATIQQDGKSFLNTGAKLQHLDYPSIRNADNNFWFDGAGINGIPQKITVQDFSIQNTISDKVFLKEEVTGLEIDSISNIRTHRSNLTGRQYDTEQLITYNI